MKFLLHPRCLWLVHTVPLLLLLTLGFLQFTLVESLLEPGVVRAWQVCGAALLLLLAGGFVAATVLDARGSRVGLTTVALYFLPTLAFAVYAAFSAGELLPFTLPDWLRDDNLILYLFTFTMPTLVYTVMVGVLRLTREASGHSILGNFGMALLVPLTVYLMVTGVIPHVSLGSGPSAQYMWVLLVTAAVVCFLFFMLRAAYLLVKGRQTHLRSYRSVYLAVLSIGLPLIGLVANNTGLFEEPLFANEDGYFVFGDFSYPAFYLIAVINGLNLSLPRARKPGLRLLQYIIGCIGLSYIGYFALVFLPYLPFSLLAFLAFGLGLLVLAPLLILIVQAYTLQQDVRYLSDYLRPTWCYVIAVSSLAVLPVILSAHYYGDRLALHAALDYVYAPAEASGPVKRPRLQRALRAAFRQKVDLGVDAFFSDQTPYLSRYYRWLVLDDLTLSDAKLNTLHRVFYGTPLLETGERTGRRELPDAVNLDSIAVSTVWDDQLGAWSSWVDLHLLADSTALGQSEYRTEFTLPPGAFVDDYYLYVGDTRQHGQLAERRTATWVYNQITNTRRDPGLLRYVAPDRLRLQVFPFLPGERRQTGIHLLHPEPFTLSLDGRPIELGGAGHEITAPVGSVTAQYVPSAYKQAGPQVKGIPQPHFILAATGQPPAEREELVALMEELVAQFPSAYADARIVITGADTHIFDYTSTDWRQALANAQVAGFFAQRAVDEVAADYLTDPTPTYPVLIEVGLDAIYTDDLYSPRHLLPDPVIRRIDADGKLDEPITELQLLPFPSAEAATTYLPVDGNGSLVVTNTEAEVIVDEGSWKDALQLRGEYLRNQLGGRHDRAAWLSEVRNSFRAQILMPTTAYLVVENDAQREALRRKQEEVLRADPQLDLAEVRRMSEPALWYWLPLLVALVYFLPTRRRRFL